MNEDRTSRLMLPLLQIGQARKEATHNEALATIDLMLAASVEDVGLDAPPLDPSPGQCWIVGDAPTGAWIGHARAIAGWTDGGWRFVTATRGMSAWCAARNRYLSFVGEWEEGVVRASRVLVDGEQVVGARQPALAMPTGGGTVDSEARATIAALLATLRTHGLIA